MAFSSYILYESPKLLTVEGCVPEGMSGMCRALMVAIQNISAFGDMAYKLQVSLEVAFCIYHNQNS